MVGDPKSRTADTLRHSKTTLHALSESQCWYVSVTDSNGILQKRLKHGGLHLLRMQISNDLCCGGRVSALDILSGRFADSFPDGEVQAPT
jgi:hypothetical protein